MDKLRSASLILISTLFEMFWIKSILIKKKYYKRTTLQASHNVGTVSNISLRSCFEYDSASFVPLSEYIKVILLCSLTPRLYGFNVKGHHWADMNSSSQSIAFISGTAQYWFPFLIWSLVRSQIAQISKLQFELELFWDYG